MKVTILDAQGNRKERKLSGLVTLDRIMTGPKDHMKLTVAPSRVHRVQQWLKQALSTIQNWNHQGHVWFDVEDASRDSARVPYTEGKFRSIGYSLTPNTILHVDANKRRSKQAVR